MSDFKTYVQLRDAMRCMIRAGAFNSLAFQDAWQQTENLKAKYNGMPPLPPEFEDREQELAEIGVEAGLR